MAPRDRALRALLIGLSATVLFGCGGGGGDDEDEPVVEDESAAGLWVGTYRVATGTNRTFNLMVTPSGQFAGAINVSSQGANDLRFIVGTGDTTGAQLLVPSGTLLSIGTATLANGAMGAPFTAFSGTVTERVSMSGSFSAAGESAQFNLNFDPLTSRGSSLATVAGVYSVTGSTSAITVTSTGQVTFNSALCIGNGTIAPVDATMNIYSWSLTFTSVAGQTCAAPGAPSGLAMLRDFNGGVGNQIFMVGAQANQAFFLVMSK